MLKERQRKRKFETIEINGVKTKEVGVLFAYGITPVRYLFEPTLSTLWVYARRPY